MDDDDDNVRSCVTTTTWNHVLQYIKDHCEIRIPSSSSSEPPLVLPYPSPFHAHYRANLHLRNEYKNHASTIWSCALTKAPIKIVAAICHVFWQRQHDDDDDDDLFPKRRLPLHMLCRYPPRQKQQRSQQHEDNHHLLLPDESSSSTTTTTTEALCEILLAYHPHAAYVRDETGYTPLHYACCYHASKRSTRFIQMLVTVVQPQRRRNRNTTTNTHDPSPAMIPHTTTRQYPLTMAAMHGMSFEPMHMLYRAYPDAKHATDHIHGRTPLHWYLSITTTSSSSSSSTTATTASSSGTTMMNATPPTPQIPVSSFDETIVQLLCSSRVARTIDVHGMAPLHILAQSLAYEYSYHHHHHPEEEDSNANSDNKNHPVSHPHETTTTTTMTTTTQWWWPSLNIVQRVLDGHVQQLLLTDQQERTPLMVLLDTAYQLQQQQKALVFDPPVELITLLLFHPDHDHRHPSLSSSSSLSHRRANKNNKSPKMSSLSSFGGGGGGGTSSLSSSSSIALIEDVHGRLPIHAALLCECGTDVIRLLYQAYPTAVYHADHQERVPLHYAARMKNRRRVIHHPPQYHDHNHENNTPLATIRVLLSSSSSSSFSNKESDHENRMNQLLHTEAMIDGRLALKLEDAMGYYPIHYACLNRHTTVEILDCMVQAYPNVATLTNPEGDLPLHCLILRPKQNNDDEDKSDPDDSHPHRHDQLHSDWDLVEVGACIQQKYWSSPQNAMKDNKKWMTTMQNRLENLCAKIRCLLRPLFSKSTENGEKWMKIADSQRGMLPLHIAVLFDAVDYETVLRMLQLHPEAATTYTQNLQIVQKSECENNSTSSSFSPLDLHDICKVRDEKIFFHQYDELKLEEWHHKRELLYSFGPTLESHRHRNDLLDRCVHIVVSELLQNDDKQGCFHFRAMTMAASNADFPDLSTTHTVSDLAIAAINRSKIGQRRRRKTRKVSNQLAPNKSRFHPTNVTRSSPEEKTEQRSFQQSASQKQHQSSLVNTYLSKLADWQDQPLKANSSIYDDDDTHLHYDVHEIIPGATIIDDDDVEEVEGCGESDNESYYSYGSQEDIYGSQKPASQNEGNGLFTTFEEESVDCEDEDSEHKTRESEIRSHYRSKETINKLPGENEVQLFDDETSNISVTSVFELAKQKVSKDEKADKGALNSQLSATDKEKANSTSSAKRIVSRPRSSYRNPPFLSEVGMRLWTFFVLYCDYTNPSDTYVKNLQAIIDQISFATLTELVSYPVPPFARYYIGKGESLDGVCFRDIASPKCRELIHKTCYFIGRYEFLGKTSETILYQSPNNEYIVVEAYEWIFTTEERTSARMPGISEENIWSTGEIPVEIGVTFRTQKRAVWIKFTKDVRAYNNEVNIRRHLGVSVDDDDRTTDSTIVEGVMPLLQHFSAVGTTRKIDEIYKLDIQDKRFNSFEICGSSSNERNILLEDYPYALVFPAKSPGTLFDYFSRFGMVSLTETKSVISEVARAIKELHDRGKIWYKKWNIVTMINFL